MVHLRMTWGRVSDSFGVLEKNPSLAANDWPQNGRPPGAKSPTFFVGKSRLTLTFPLLVSQLGSIPRAWKLHSTDAADYGAEKHIWQWHGPFYLSSGVKVWMQPVQGLLVPSYPPMEGRWKSCPPQLSLDCVSTRWIPRNCRFKVWFKTHHRLNAWGCS